MFIRRVFKSVAQLKVVALAAVAILASSLVAAAPAHAAVANWQKGISIQSRSNTDFASDTFKQSIQKAKADGVNFVMLVIQVHQDNIYSSTVYAGNDTPTDATIATGVSYIKSQGLNAGLVVHDDPLDGQWRAFINPTDPITWFNTYGSLLTRYAGIAQANGASEVIIGTELSTMTKPVNTTSWVNLIKNVRATFSGSLTYSAQHSGYMGDVNQVGFWSSLDYVGISAYYSLYGRTDQAGMESAWQDADTNEVSPIAAKTGKKVLFTEVGFMSRDGATNDPGSAYTLNTAVNTTLQATAYTSLFDYWNKSSVLAGAFLWDWSSDPNAGGSNNRDYTPQNKPAEAVMQQWYTSPPTSGSGGSTTTPIAPTTFTAALSGSNTATINTPTNNSISLSTNNSLTNAIVDVEVYDAGGKQVNQTVYSAQNLSTTASNYSLGWTPGTSGTYTVKVGVFTANWSANLYWNNNIGTINVAAPVTPPATSGGTTPGMGGGTTTSAPPTTPTQPPVATPPTAISIWWPGVGVVVGGVQPFKAVIDGRSLSTYDMYWQVDGGTLNKMSDVNDAAPHKESSVDLTNWKWNASHNYVINFVAKDQSGAVISQQAVTVTIY